MLLHLQLNHVLRTRDAIIKNDAKLRNAPNEDILDDNSYLDKGFTRPKVFFHTYIEKSGIPSVVMHTLKYS